MLRTLALSALLLPAALHAGAADGLCRAHSRPQPPAVVELFTSEGCSSCPPADRWLSTFKGRPDVLALAFHVSYWDRLGWPDRFATAATTGRQHLLQRASGASYVYTPQVVHNGRDWRAWGGWGGTTLQPLPPSALAISLEQRGRRVTATLAGIAAGDTLAGYWAVLEDGHASRVRAGENAGTTLRHDHVVTLYQPLAAWRGQPAQAQTLELPAPQGGSARRVAFVLTDAQGARPLQVAVLAC